MQLHEINERFRIGAALGVSICSLYFAFGGVGVNSAHAAESRCQTVTMPDGGKQVMCRDSNGEWKPQSQVAASPENSQNNFPQRAEVSYRGTFQITVTPPLRVNYNNLNLGNLLSAAINNPGKQFAGQMDIVMTIQGVSATARISGTGLISINMTGTVRNGYCKLLSTDSRFAITYEGKCSREGFSGRTHGKNYEGATQSGQFDTQLIQVVDADERDRQAAIANAERERQASIANAARERTATRELPGLLRQFDAAKVRFSASMAAVKRITDRTDSKRAFCPSVSNLSASMDSLDGVWDKINGYSNDFEAISTAIGRQKLEAMGNLVDASRNYSNTMISICDGWM